MIGSRSMLRRRAAFAFVMSALIPVAPAFATDTQDPGDEFTRASARVTAWDGPVTGPAGVMDKTIVYISGDLRNGGILGVANGMREAAKVLGWRVKVIDLRGDHREACARAVAEAIKIKAGGVVIGGFDAPKNANALNLLSVKGIPVLAWHSAASAGPIAGSPVVLNVATDASKVARVAAQSVVATRREGRAGVVIFTDTRFAIAKAKSDAMAEVLRASPGCEVLEVCDVPLDAAAKIMPDLTRRLLAKHGAKWTHALAINDLYFDHATPVFAVAGIPPEGGISCVSAGDGSLSAFVRIQAGLYQTATVAEPLNLQGWQLMDELNRIFAGAPPSGYVTPVHLVNAANIKHDGGAQRRFDPNNDYREAYKKIWNR
jgi:ribose transport system substrate-binding protein